MKEIKSFYSNYTKRSIRVYNAKLRGTHTQQQWQELVSFSGNKCVICGNSNVKIQKDHIIPLYQDGCDCIHNLQPVCGSCNSSKGPDSEDYRNPEWKLHVSGVV